VGDELGRAGITVFERGWLSSNNVLIRGDNNHGAVVVDTGYCTHSTQTVALLKQALAAEPLSRILNTHLHSDHCSGNAAIQAEFGCGSDVPVGEADTVDLWDETKLTYADTGQQCPRFRRAGVLEAPSTIVAGRLAWQVIASPGHDPKSVALYQPDLQLLISADALWENGFGVVFPELEGIDAFDAVGSTLDAFSRLQVRLVIPGHGPPFQDFNAAIARARSRLDDFFSDPKKHAIHAAKVLVKFRLLEIQSDTLESFHRWLHSTRYFDLVRQQYFPKTAREQWERSIIEDMHKRGSVGLSDHRIFNLN
jgi:glyoxylase-like metal-dependent hydrolase (beta-lactamase superfamily II)